jgi:hypothetical protein
MNSYARVLGTLAVLGVMLALAAPLRAADQTHEGKVKSAAAGQVVITVADKDHTFKVDATTAITLDGKAAKATELKAGDSAKVTSKLAEGGGMLATKIEAKRGA